MSQATVQQTEQSHSSGSELYQVVPDRLRSRIDPDVFNADAQFIHDGRQVSAPALLAGLKTHLSPKPDPNGGMYTSMSKEKAVSSAVTHLASNYGGWFTADFTADALEDAFWHGQSSSGPDLGDYELVEATDYVNLSSDTDVERVVVPLVGLLLTHVREMDDTNRATPDQGQQQTVVAQREIKRTIIDRVRDAGLSNAEVREALKAAQNDLDRLEDGIDTRA